MQRSYRTGQDAFTLIELLVVVAIIALLISILLPALAEAKRLSRAAICKTQIYQLSTANANYAIDFQDRIPSLTWRANVRYDWPPTPADTHTQAAANQAAFIMRKQSNRTDLQPIYGWIPNVFYTHLVVSDYLSQKLPEQIVACPEDAQRLSWQKAVREHGRFWWRFISSTDRPGGSIVDDDEQRWPYSSSYSYIVASWSPDQSFHVGTTTIDAIDQHGFPHFLFDPPTTTDGTYYGNRLLSEVRFPAQKIQMHEYYDRHFQPRRKVLYCQYPQAQIHTGMFDGSVQKIKTSQSNSGFRPRSPLDPGWSLVTYKPAPWEPPAPTANPADSILRGYFRFTRAGLKGIDIGGTEIPARAP